MRGRMSFTLTCSFWDSEACIFRCIGGPRRASGPDAGRGWDIQGHMPPIVNQSLWLGCGGGGIL